MLRRERGWALDTKASDVWEALDSSDNRVYVLDFFFQLDPSGSRYPLAEVPMYPTRTSKLRRSIIYLR